jgi:hypothetical protein
LKLQEGPGFGALIIGVGVGYLMFRRDGQLLPALAIGFGVAVIDYFFLSWIQSFKKKK